jgi:hypothetical protein
MITNAQLRAQFLTAPMRHYFLRKLAPLPESDVLIRIEEALKYLNMAVHCPGDIPFSREIDEVWHYWVLETQEYERLCRRLQGGRFLHHTSNDYASFFDSSATERRIDLNSGLAILASYVLNYGPIEADRIVYWPLATRLMQRLGGDLGELNARLAAPALAGAVA